MSTFKSKKHYSLIRNIFQWKHPDHIETSQPIRLPNQLAGFYMISVKTNKMTKLLLNQVLAFLQQHEGSSCLCKSIQYGLISVNIWTMVDVTPWCSGYQYCTT